VTQEEARKMSSISVPNHQHRREVTGATQRRRFMTRMKSWAAPAGGDRDRRDRDRISCGKPSAGRRRRRRGLPVYVPPGQYDEFYAFLSGGFSGQVAVYGLPSGRLLRVIPVFSQMARRDTATASSRRPC